LAGYGGLKSLIRLKNNFQSVGVQELCWNNFGNNDGAKESRIIPEF